MDMQSIQTTIESEINPMLKLHGGSCEAVSLEDGILEIRLNGGCQGCPSSKITLFNHILPILKEKHTDILTDIRLVI